MSSTLRTGSTERKEMGRVSSLEFVVLFICNQWKGVLVSCVRSTLVNYYMC